MVDLCGNKGKKEGVEEGKHEQSGGWVGGQVWKVKPSALFSIVVTAITDKPTNFSR